jgi:hypothetical protein
MIYVANEIFTETILSTALQYANDKVTSASDKLKGINQKLEPVNKVVSDVKNETDRIASHLHSQNVDGRSIVARARNSVLQFPIYMTVNIRINEAQIISKMFERVYATLVQTVLSHNKYIDEDEANNLVFLKNFHTNIKEAANAVNEWYKPIDEIDSMMYESVFYKTDINDSISVEFKAIPTINEDLICENARLIHEPLAGLAYIFEAGTPDRKRVSSTTTVTTRTDTNSEGTGKPQTKERIVEKPEKILSEHDMRRIANNLKEAAKKSGNPNHPDLNLYGSTLRNQIKNGREVVTPDGIIQYREFTRGKDGKLLGAKTPNDIYTTKGEFFIGKKTEKTTTENKRSVTTNVTTQETEAETLDAPHLLKDTDIKKINGLLPYSIEAHFRIKGDGSYVNDVRYIIGIKSVLHPINPKDLGADIHDIMTGDIKTLRKVRYRTGEIGFKEYWFNLSSIKSDAAKHINYDKRWISTLKRLGNYRKMYGSLLKQGVHALTGGHVPIPNATMVLLQTDVAAIKDQSGIDLEKVSNAKKLAHRLFMVSMVIVDATRGTMKVLFPDNDVDWDVQSIAAIDTEVSKLDNSQMLKELNKMINR